MVTCHCSSGDCSVLGHFDYDAYTAIDDDTVTGEL
jgi:hypothetical protein